MSATMTGPAADKRAYLASHYDREVANTLGLAKMAHEAGLKSTFDNLVNLAQRQRTYAQNARRRERLREVLAMLAAEQGPSSDAAFGPPGFQSAEPQSTMAGQGPPSDSWAIAEDDIPQYAFGTGYHRGGPAIVGEAGPEMLNLPRGSQVIPMRRPGSSFGGGYRGGMAAGAPAAPAGLPEGWERQDMTPGSWQIPISSFTPNGQFSGPALLQALQWHGAGAGAFDPLGSEAQSRMESDAILGGMGARQTKATRIADIYAHGDPAFRAYARLKASNDTSSEAAQALREARARNAASAIDFIRNTYGQQLGAVTRRDERSNPWAQIGGQAAGRTIGAFL